MNNKYLYAIFALYTACEIYNYYRHRKMVNNINNYKTPAISINETKQKHIRETVMSNIIDHDKDSKKFIEHLFYNKINFESIPRNMLHTALGSMLFLKDKYNYQESLEIEGYINQLELKHNTYLKYDSNKTIKYMIFGKTPIYTWYKPIMMISLMYATRKIFNIYLKKLGFVQYKFENGFVVWVRTPKIIKRNPLIVFHCSIGGCMPYYKFIKEIMNDRILLLPELPGISWENFVYKPPLLNEVAENLNEIVSSLNITNYDLLCHSFGSLLCMKYFYKYHKQIKKIICVESGVIINHIFGMYTEFYEIMNMTNGKSKDFLDYACAPITHRDPYIQFYFHRDLSVTDTVLLGREEENNTEIHLVLSENDDKIPAEYYCHYVKSKKLPYNIKIFDKRTHGAFAYDTEFQQYVIEIANKN